MAASTGASDTAPLINANPQLQSYYNSLESRLGYRLVLGGTRHFGYWDHDTYWPFPVSKGLRAMEDKLAAALALPKGATVMDAGCGVGHVALRMATKHGLRVQCIDLVEHHIVKARRNIQRSGLPEGTVTAQRMDYHHLENIPDSSLDGVYTMETFVHATEPEAVLEGFHRVIRPGGRITLFEYEHNALEGEPEDLAESMRKINEFAAMPTNAVSHSGVFAQMLEDAGFVDIEVRDYSENIRPITRLFWLIGVIPFFFVKLFGLERYFINTVAGVEMHRGHGRWRYVGISASKPGEPEIAKNQ
ncbi:hypothetical protein ACHAQA_003641 [Verticillium albo-atrum]